MAEQIERTTGTTETTERETGRVPLQERTTETTEKTERETERVLPERTTETTETTRETERVLPESDPLRKEPDKR